jgi:hypothetical protein
MPGHFTTLWKLLSIYTPSGLVAWEATEYIYSTRTESVNKHYAMKTLEGAVVQYVHYHTWHQTEQCSPSFPGCCLQRNGTWYSLNKRLGAPQSLLDALEKKISCTLLGIEPCFPGLPAHTHHYTDWAILAPSPWLEWKFKSMGTFLGKYCWVFRPSCKQNHADTSWDTHGVPKITILFWLRNTYNHFITCPKYV